MRIATKIILSAISLFISLGFVEVMVRYIAPQQVVSPYIQADKELGNISKPNQDLYGHLETLNRRKYSVKTNEFGFRVKDAEPVDMSSERKKILVLGDSVTFGVEIDAENTFFEMIKNKLESKNPQLQFLNAGHGGYSTGHIFKNLRKYNDTLDISATIYFMNANDLTDNINQNINYRVFSYVKSADGSIELKEEKVYLPFKRFLLTRTPYAWLNQHSQAFMLFKKIAKAFKREMTAPIPDDTATPWTNNTIEETYNVSLAYLRKLSNYSSISNIPLLIVWLPTPPELKKELDTAACTHGMYYSDFRKRILADKDIIKENIFFINPTNAFRNALISEKETDIFIDGWGCNFHFNESGNRLFADIIYNDIEKFLGNVLFFNIKN